MSELNTYDEFLNKTSRKCNSKIYRQSQPKMNKWWSEVDMRNVCPIKREI